MLELLFDFTDLQAANEWHAIDDRVMGGISQSRLRHDPAGHAVFEGEVSLEQNGGFTSVRSTPGDRGHPGTQACLIVCAKAAPRDALNGRLSYAPAPTSSAPCAIPSIETAMPTLESTTYRGFSITTRWFEVLKPPDLLRLQVLGCAQARQFSGSFSVAPPSGNESPWQEFPPLVFDTGPNASSHALEAAKRSIDFRFAKH